MKAKDINQEIVKKKVDQLKVINQENFVLIKDLAKELKVKSTELMDHIEANEKLFNQNPTKKGMSVKSAYLKAEENPLTEEFVAVQKELNKKVIKISYYNNYGWVNGYYIKESENMESQYLNTKDKINLLKDKYSLKPAGYTIGGLGDNSFHKIQDGFEVTSDLLNTLISEGWKIIGEFKKESNFNIDSIDTRKIIDVKV